MTKKRPINDRDIARIIATPDGALLFQSVPAYQRDPIADALNGLTYQQIAHNREIPIGTVRSRISRGRAKLIKLVEKKKPQSEDRGLETTEPLRLG